MTNNSNRYVVKSLFKKLLPVQIATVAVLNISGLLNSLIIGTMMSAEHLSVLGFIVPLNCIHLMLGGGIAVGSQTLCGRYVGSGDRKKIGETYSTAFVLCVVIGVLLSLIYFLFPYQIASLLGATGNALEYTVDYLRGYALSVVFLLFSTIMIPFLQLSNASKVMLISIITLTITNVVFVIVGISVFNANMFGVGLACSFSNIIGAVVILIYCLSSKCPIRFSFKSFSFYYVKRIFNFGLPNTVKPFCLAIRNWVFNNVAVKYGGVMAVSALTIVGNVASIADSVIGGIEGSTCMMSSIYYGERDKVSLQDITPVALKIGAPLQAVIYLLIFILAGPFAKLFGAQGEFVGFTVNAMRIIFLYLLVNIYMNVFVNVYKGIGKTQFVNVVTVIIYVLIPIGFCLTLTKLVGINGVWISYVVPEPICFIGTVVYSACKQHRIPKSLTEVTYISDNFGIEDDNRYNVKISSVNEISRVTQDIQEFCRKKGMDDKKGFYCALCIEELAVAVLRETPSLINKITGKKEIDLLLIYENEGVSILMRNNYPPFDPIEWANIHDKVDPMKSMGIRMVSKFAQEISYSAVINLNVFYVRIG